MNEMNKINELIEAAKKALDAYKRLDDIDGMYSWSEDADNLRKALESLME